MGSICEAPSVQLSYGATLISELQFQSSLISIHQGDLSEEISEAIVISNNPILSSKLTATRNIINLSGPKVAAECNDLLSSLNQFDEGMAIYTTAGELETDYLIHAIIPEWRGDEKSEELFVESILNCLKIAKKLEISSISFPLLNNQENSIPKNVAADIMIKTIKNYILEKKDNDGVILNIRLVSNENPSVRLLKSSLDRIFFDELKFSLKGEENKENRVKGYKSVSFTAEK